MKGLCNIGQTCYLNAALQCLVHCPNLANYMLSGLPENDACTKKKGAHAVAMAFVDFVREYWAHAGPGPSTEAIHASLARSTRNFKLGSCHDAHEALCALLDKVHDGLGRLRPGEHAVRVLPSVCSKDWADSLKGGACSVVSEVFRGQVRVDVRAGEYTSTTHDHFTCLSLGVGAHASLTQCLHQHFGPEEVDDFVVDGQKATATVHKRATYLPRILVIHLKRFDGKGKVDRFVGYPSELDMGEYSVPGIDHHYQLFGVCLHRGDLDDGHYTACCEVKGVWHYMDDETATAISNINDIIQRDAYLLLYKRL